MVYRITAAEKRPASGPKSPARSGGYRQISKMTKVWKFAGKSMAAHMLRSRLRQQHGSGVQRLFPRGVSIALSGASPGSARQRGPAGRGAKIKHRKRSVTGMMGFALRRPSGKWGTPPACRRWIYSLSFHSWESVVCSGVLPTLKYGRNYKKHKSSRRQMQGCLSLLLFCCVCCGLKIGAYFQQCVARASCL